VSADDAKILLLYDLTEINLVMQDLIFTPLNQNQIDALSSFTFNVGVEAFRDSAVLARINEGALLQAACGIDLWRRAEIQGEGLVVDALVRRRAAEKALFLTPIDGWTPAPSPVVRPALDRDLDGVVPRARPSEVIAPLTGDLATAHVAPAVVDAPTPAPAEAETFGEGSPIAEIAAAPFAAPEPIAEAKAEPPVSEALTEDGLPEAEPLASIHPQLHGLSDPPEVLPFEVVEYEIAAPTEAPRDPAPDLAETYHWRLPQAAEPKLETPPPEAAPAEGSPVALSAEAGPPIEAAEAAHDHGTNLKPEAWEPDIGAVLDEAPTMFKPIAVVHDQFAETPRPTPHAAVEPLLPAAESEAQPAPRPSVDAPPFRGHAFALDDRGETPAVWSAEAFRRRVLFANLAPVDPSGILRTPAAARISGLEGRALQPERGHILPLLLLGLFGLIVFTGGAYWTFTARAAGGGVSPLILGGVLFLVGIGCVVASVYYLVHWFLGQET
jgi:lysozyme